MTKWVRAAEVNKGLIIVLVLLVVIAGGFYAFKYRSAAKEEGEVQINLGKTWTLYCPECDKEFEFEGDSWKKVAKEGRKLQCPECKQFVARWGKRPVTTGVVAP